MTEAQRPDPDRLLEAIQKDAARQRRGQFKLFLGMAAGVGKTYAMLQAARERQAEGVDVVVGYVETHGRAETEALLAGLEVLPRQMLDYRGALLPELDLDALLARRPQLALVDELAHSNVPGARHTKRYQDIIELLEAGIDVWTTVNVQHFESRADAVRQITGITVHERVPDSLLDLADEIELVDLAPEDLRKRLAEGKVYTPDRSEVAAKNFFRTGNLTALREMALRLTAEHVDHQLQDYMQLKRIAGPWKSGERLLVAVGPSPFSAQLVRWTRRMAYNLEGSWLAVYIDSGQVLSAQAQAWLTASLELARSLGAEIVTAADPGVANGLLRVASQRNITQIVVGKPERGRGWWRRESLVDALIADSGEIDIYVVTGKRDQTNTRAQQIRPPTPVGWRAYFYAALVVAGVILIDLLLVASVPWVGYQVVGLTALLAVLLIAIYLGRGPALLGAALSAVSWDFLFIEPRLTFAVSQAQDTLLLAMYFAIALFTGNLTARLRRQERQARHSAERMMALYTLAHETSTARDLDHVLQTALTQLRQVFDAEVAVLLSAGGTLARQAHPSSTLHVDEKDYGVALWSYEHGAPAGMFADTLPSASALYLPLRTANRTVGVIGIRTRARNRLTFDQEVLLQTFISQIALVVERELLDEAARKAMMLRESERLYTTLLNSISHELRTPIATITAATGSLLDGKTGQDAAARAELTENIQAAAQRLNRLVENLLDMSRLESGRLGLKRDWCDVGEIIGVAVAQLKSCLADRQLEIRVAPDLPLIAADFRLLEQVFVNVLDNACRYTPEGSRIAIDARRLGGRLQIEIRDSGPGIPDAALERIFEKFYRLPGAATGGTGLGLSIARGLVEAHGGTIAAANDPAGGLTFTIVLPLTEAPPPVREAPP